MSYNFLSNEDFIKILQNRFNTQNVELKRAEICPLSETVEGFMGEHYTLKITYKLDTSEGTEHFFIKTKPYKSDVQKEISNNSNVFRKETFLYGFLLTEFNKMSYSTNFAPRCFYCKDEAIIVLENLMLNGFKLVDRRQCFDINQCKTALKSLAYLHGNAISYEETKSKELGRTYILKEENPEIFDEAFFVDDPEAGGLKYLKATTLCFEEIAKLLPESPEWKETFVRKINEFNTVKVFWQNLPYRQTITHGDLWSNNMLFRYSSDTAVHCCLLDYQLIRHHHSGYDVALLIYSNTRRNFRKKHFNELLDYYYDVFDAVLADNGFEAEDILPKDHFLKTVEALKSVALVQTAAIKTLTLLPKKLTTDIVNAGGEKLGDLYFKDRPHLVKKGFQTDETFREIITDDAYDLYEHL